jgi:hypothetical protein
MSYVRSVLLFSGEPTRLQTDVSAQQIAVQKVDGASMRISDSISKANEQHNKRYRKFIQGGDEF